MIDWWSDDIVLDNTLLQINTFDSFHIIVDGTSLVTDLSGNLQV